MRFVPLVLACLVFLAVAETAAAAPADFAISYQRSGGLAPSTSRLVVKPGRHAVAETSGSRAGERRVAFEISTRAVEGLERGLRRAHFGSLESPGPSGCADCFGYSIAYRGHRVSLDESQLPGPLRAVVNRLETIIAVRALPPNA